MALIVLASLSTESTLRYLMYDSSRILVALTENSSFFNGYGNNGSRVITIGVFKTGFALLG
jgi:hypothetical protein